MGNATISDSAKPPVTSAGVFQWVEKGRELGGSGLREWAGRKKDSEERQLCHDAWLQKKNERFQYVP